MNICTTQRVERTTTTGYTHLTINEPRSHRASVRNVDHDMLRMYSSSLPPVLDRPIDLVVHFRKRGIALVVRHPIPISVSRDIETPLTTALP